MGLSARKQWAHPSATEGIRLHRHRAIPMARTDYWHYRNYGTWAGPGVISMRFSADKRVQSNNTSTWTGVPMTII